MKTMMDPLSHPKSNGRTLIVSQQSCLTAVEPSARSLTGSAESRQESHGYSADTERTMQSGESTIPKDFLACQKKRVVVPLPVSQHKRSRVEEKNFLASTINFKLLRESGQKMETRFSSRNAEIDMTNVELKFSSAFVGSPYLAATTLPLVDALIENSSEDIVSLLKSCRSFYDTMPDPLDSRKTDSSDSCSSTSSMTDVESSAEEENALNISLPMRSIGDALALSTTPRIITLSDDPFVIVHINAAFSRLMAVSSTRAQGRELSCMVHDCEEIHKALDVAARTLTGITLAKQVFRSRSVAKGILSSVIISPLGPPNRPPTHFVLELKSYSSAFIRNEFPTAVYDENDEQLAMKVLG